MTGPVVIFLTWALTGLGFGALFYTIGAFTENEYSPDPNSTIAKAERKHDAEYEKWKNSISKLSFKEISKHLREGTIQSVHRMEKI